MIPDEEIAEMRDLTGPVPTGLSVTPAEFRAIYERQAGAIRRLLEERGLFVDEHQAALRPPRAEHDRAWAMVEAWR